MSQTTRRSVLVLGGAGLLAAALPLLASAQAATPKNRALFQVTDNDPQRWNTILNNMDNLREELAGEGVEIELVAYSGGIFMLKADSSVKQRIAEAAQKGVRIVACQNTMRNMKLTEADMSPAVGYVSAGVVEVVRKQQQGWAYVRT